MDSEKHSYNNSAQRKAWLNIIGITFTFCILAVLALTFGYNKYEEFLQGEAEKVIQNKVDSYGHALTVAINERMRILENIEAFIQEEASEYNLDTNFQIYAAGLTAGFEGINYIALAPQDEITYIHPLLGNEEFFGEKIQLPKRMEYAYKKTPEHIIIDIPDQLVQGERVLNAFIPIYFDGNYWGIATIQMKMSRLLYEAGLNKNIPDIDYTVRDSKGNILRGENNIFSLSPVTYAIPLPGCYWELAAIPNQYWEGKKLRPLISYKIISCLILLIVAGFVLLISIHYTNLQLTVEQQTEDLSKSESQYQHLQAESEEALMQSEERFRNVFENSGEGIFLHDGEEHFLDANNKTLELFACTHKAFLKAHIKDFFPPEEQKIAKTNLGQVLTKQFVNFESICITKSGKLFPVEISAKLCTVNKKQIVQGVVRDITDRKKAEEEQENLQEQLHQAQKMDAIGQLAGGIAHDFNNQLSGILGYASLLRGKLPKGEKLIQYADKILKGVQRSTDLTNQLLAFSRKGKYLTVPVDIHEIIKEIIELLSHSIDKRIKFHLKLKAKFPKTLGDPSQLQNALLNLAINARDAMPDGGDLTFKTNIVKLNQKSCNELPQEITPGKYIHIIIADTGTGMSETIKSRIFEPFFTTKPPGKGTGMGLASVYGSIKNHHGTIFIESELGKGTNCHIYLQLLQKDSIEHEDVKNEIIPDTEQTKHILLVDDEPIIRELGKEMLVLSGYQITTCSDGKEAVQLYKKHWRTIDLVILDMVMPEMSGKDAFTAMKKINPDIAVLLASGYSVEGDAQYLLNNGAKGFISKPFTQLKLTEQVADIIGTKHIVIP